MERIQQKVLTGERSLFHGKDLEIYDTVFGEGESPLKESENIKLDNCLFQWKYPLWYAKNIEVTNTDWQEMARAGVWYTENISVKDCIIEAPKNFRRCTRVSLENVTFPNASETFWSCNGVILKNVSAKGDYFAMNCSDMELDGFKLSGNYSFDGVKNATIKNSRLLSKDAFWNSDNITVIDSFISGEYIGWNARNLTFINCTIESLQGLCYVENLVMKNCRLLNTTLSFEYSSADADIKGHIDSVFNPSSGIIRADSIGELTVDPERVDPEKTKIIINKQR